MGTVDDERGGPLRLSALDASFLAVESPTAHMHVGWVVLLSPPADRAAPSFTELRRHIESRLWRAPRYRQRLAPVPFGLHDPLWVDDEDFDIRRHVRRSRSTSPTRLAGRVMSTPLDRDHPLWELWITDRLGDGRLGIVGKVHHCMVDGLAAVELAAVLFDPTPEPPPVEPDGWAPAPTPGQLSMLTGGLRDRVSQELDLVRRSAALARSPERLFGLAGEARRAARALAHSLAPPAPPTRLNRRISPQRSLATARRPLEDLRRIRSHFGVTINDVVLAVASGGVRRFLEQHGDAPMRLKAMVPVNLRQAGRETDLGNHLSWVFMQLPVDEPDPVRRLEDVHMAMSDRRDAGDPQGGDAVLRAVGHAPHPIQRVFTRVMSGRRIFNLVVSNIPGPSRPLYMLGCEAKEAYPIVPLADRHAVSIGVTSIGEGAFFGVYADPKALPDARRLAGNVEQAVEELLEHV